MDSKEFKYFRQRLDKTQKLLAQLLGTSLKAIHSYEQGWRVVPSHVERQMLFLVSQINDSTVGNEPCWDVKNCPTDRRKQCPAWEFRAGALCWFINGTHCEGAPHKDWNEKMKICRSCEVLTPLLQSDPG